MPATRSTIPRLLAISDPAASPGEAWRRWCTELGAAGVDGLQVRCKGGSDRQLLALAQAAALSGGPGTVLVNSRIDIALAARADGVHLPAAGLPIAQVRTAWVSAAGVRGLVGRSTHTPQEVLLARDQGADYVVFGPVFDTPSKAGRIPARGLEGLAAAAAHGLPVFALGGIDGDNAQRVIDHGAWGVAAIRWFARPAEHRPQYESLLRNWPAG
jgi:thiamine-phosphate pyrophosphorylase